MKLEFKSKYTAMQIYALAQSIVADRELSRNYYFGNELRALEYNAQRNLPEESERFFMKRFGKTVEQILNEIGDRAARKKVEAKQQQEAVVVRVTDLSKQGQPAPQNPNMLVAEACHGGCGLRLALPLADVQAGAVTCWCLNCRPKAQSNSAAAEKLLQRFLANVPSFYLDPKGFNASIMAAEIDRRKLDNPTYENLLEVYAENRSKMLQRLNPEEVRAMTSAQYRARYQQDPGMGGVDLAACKEGQDRGTQNIFSTNESRLMPFAAQGSIGGRGGKGGL
jgi:hypothetical protein